jgi:signal transduction histidine kinase
MQRIWKQQSLFLPIIIAATLALILLATLQYYWAGEVSRGERERMQINLQTGVTRFSEDFDKELARAYFSFQMDAETLQQANWERFAQKYDSWNTKAPYPGLVDNVYLIEIHEAGRTRLSYFNREDRSFKQAIWPQQLTEMRQRLTQWTQQAALGDPPQQPFQLVDDNIVALIVPVAHAWLLSDGQQQSLDADLIYGDMLLRPIRRPCWQCRPDMQAVPLAAFTIVMLDRHYIAQEFIPSLAQRHFVSGAQSEYHFAVVTHTNPQTMIYRSRPGLALDEMKNADATARILNVRPDEFNRMLLDPLDTDSQLNNGRPDRLRIALIDPVAESDDSPSVNLNGGWSLIVKHQVGSLDAAVFNLRVRNLVLSFSTLLLLAISVAMIIVSTRRAQRLARQQMDFVTAVSHELRTPLAVICSAGENLADGVVHEPKQARQYGSVIHNEGRRLTEMVEQVLEFAGAQSGRQVYATGPVEIDAVIDSAVAGCRPLNAGNDIEIDIAIDPNLPPVQADPNALRRAIQNLLSNAIKYGSEVGWVGVRAQLSTGMRGDEVQISVQDRGLGIEPDDLPHIFEPFYRGRDVIAAQIKGSGLGLSLVKHIVETMGGRLAVESVPGHGSTFTLYLPCVTPETYTERMPTTKDRRGSATT